MKMVCTNDGKKRALDLFFGNSFFAGEDFVIELFQNSLTVINTSVTADFVPSTFVGYAPRPVLSGDFAAAIITSNQGVADLTPPPTWTCTGGTSQLAYGWYLYGVSSGLTYFGQNFDSPRSMVVGATESLDPFTIKDKSFT